MTVQPNPDVILAEARRWIGTPYLHQASKCQAGTDCLGLVRGVWRHLYGHEPCKVPPYSPDWAEAGRSEALLSAAEEWLVRKDLLDEAPGDVLLFRIMQGGPAKHLGIQGGVTRSASFIHAYSGHTVLETSLSAPWRRRIVGRFKFPERIA